MDTYGGKLTTTTTTTIIGEAAILVAAEILLIELVAAQAFITFLHVLAAKIVSGYLNLAKATPSVGREDRVIRA